MAHSWQEFSHVFLFFDRAEILRPPEPCSTGDHRLIRSERDCHHRVTKLVTGSCSCGCFWSSIRIYCGGTAAHLRRWLFKGNRRPSSADRRGNQPLTDSGPSLSSFDAFVRDRRRHHAQRTLIKLDFSKFLHFVAVAGMFCTEPTDACEVLAYLACMVAEA